MEWKQDAPQLKEAFDRKGYLVLRGFMSGAEAQEINRQIERYIADVLPTLPENEAFYEVKNDPQTIMRLQNMCGNDAFFKQMSTSESCVDLSDFLM